MLALLLLQVAGPMLEKPRSAAPTRSCTPRPGEDLVVCGKGQEQFRLRPITPRADDGAPAIPKAETAIGPGMTLAAEAEQGNVGPNLTNRAMVRWKLKF